MYIRDKGQYFAHLYSWPGEVEAPVRHVIDATDVVLGRLASQTAILSRGKHKPTFAPHVDTGDFVIIVNAEEGRPDRCKARAEACIPPLGLPRRSEVRELLRAA